MKINKNTLNINNQPKAKYCFSKFSSPKIYPQWLSIQNMHIDIAFHIKKILTIWAFYFCRNLIIKFSRVCVSVCNKKSRFSTVYFLNKARSHVSGVSKTPAWARIFKVPIGPLKGTGKMRQKVPERVWHYLKCTSMIGLSECWTVLKRVGATWLTSLALYNTWEGTERKVTHKGGQAVM